MGIFRRSDSPYWWLWLETAPQGRQKVRTDVLVGPREQRGHSRKLAEQVYFAEMGKLASTNHHLPQAHTRRAITFAKFATWWAEHRLPLRRGADREREILPRLRAAFGPYELRDITPQRVQEWITARLHTPTVIAPQRRTAPREAWASPQTVNREIDLLKAILKAATPTYLEASPLFGMPRLPTKTPKRRVMTEDEERRLLAVMRPDDLALFLIGLDSLVRLHDILDVTWSDLEGRRLWIADPKAGGGFWVPISVRAAAALAQIARGPTAYVFSRRRAAATERDRRNGIRQMLERYCAQATPPIPFGRRQAGLTFHWATRRTGATRMLTRHVDPGTVQKIGRWKNPDVVLGIYHELLDEAAVEAVELVGRGGHSRPVPAKAHPRPKHSRNRSGR